MPCCFCRGAGVKKEYRYSLVEKVIFGIEYGENSFNSYVKILTREDDKDFPYRYKDYRIYDFSVNRDQLFATVEEYAFADKQVAEIVLKEINDSITKAKADDEE